MELLFATNLPAWGGGEKWMLEAARAMADRGHAVCVAAPEGAQLSVRAGRAGLDTLAVPFTRDLDPVSFGRVFRHCLRRRVDVLCLNMDRVLRVAGPAARLAGVPVVMPRRGSEFPLKGHLNYRFHYQQVATGMIVNSDATRRTLCRGIAWAPAGRVHVLHNGLDLEPYRDPRPRQEVRRELGCDPDALILITVGELTTRKNAALLVAALPELRRECGDVRLWLVGEGDQRAPLQEQARAAGVAGAVHVLGFRDDVPDLLAAADVLVHPARVEGFGYAVAEGMAAGLAVVATRASSIPEIVDEGRTGRLFTSDDRDALVTSLRPYLDDPALRAAHGAAGRARVAECFDLSHKMDELESLFLAELAGRRGTGHESMVA